MTLEKSQFTTMTTRQKAIAGIILVVILILLWQVIGMFRGGSKKAPTGPNNKMVSNGGTAPGGASNMQASAPQPAQLTTQRTTGQQQSEFVKLQQETQDQYVAALNELQMLKLTQQIAETNKDIAAAKLATVTAQKDIVDLLTKPAPPPETPASFSPGLTSGAPQPIPPATTQPQPAPQTGATTTITTTTQETSANYIVISVSQLLNRWSAVLGYQGKLYSVFVGDVLPPDQSTVISINKYSVILEKEGVQRKISLVPII